MLDVGCWMLDVGLMFFKVSSRLGLLLYKGLIDA